MELARGTVCLKRSLLKNSSESVLKERKQDSSFVPKKYLRHNQSLFVGDELSVLLAKRGFAEIIGEQFATGRKEGISIMILLQDLDAIINCSASAQILANRGITITGLTRHGSTNAYIDHLNFPEEVINLNATENIGRTEARCFPDG